MGIPRQPTVRELTTSTRATAGSGLDPTSASYCVRLHQRLVTPRWMHLPPGAGPALDWRHTSYRIGS